MNEKQAMIEKLQTMMENERLKAQIQKLQAKLEKQPLEPEDNSDL